MKNTITLCLLILLGSSSIYATTWETVEKGFWADSTVWSNGIVPDTTSSDTFYIKHPIVITNDLIFTSGAYILIEEDGGICGHHKTTLLNNTKLITYGILELDDLYVNSGNVLCLSGDVILTTSATIRGTGGTLKVDSVGRLTVGTWFECVLPNYAFLLDETTGVESTTSPSEVTVYPNPFSTTLTVDSREHPRSTADPYTKARIYDLLGQEVYATLLTQPGIQQLDLALLPDAMYLLHLSNAGGIYTSRIIKGK